MTPLQRECLRDCIATCQAPDAWWAPPAALRSDAGSCRLRRWFEISYNHRYLCYRPTAAGLEALAAEDERLSQPEPEPVETVRQLSLEV